MKATLWIWIIKINLTTSVAISPVIKTTWVKTNYFPYLKKKKKCVIINYNYFTFVFIYLLHESY